VNTPFLVNKIASNLQKSACYPADHLKRLFKKKKKKIKTPGLKSTEGTEEK